MNQAGVKRAPQGFLVRLPENRLLEAVFAAITREAAIFGIELPAPSPEAAARLRRVDPVSGDESLVCAWCNDWGQRAGDLVLNPDGSFYAEQKVLRHSPSDTRWVVESNRAWGRNGDEVRSEARLLPAS